ncbi:MAG: hypothetical protein JWL89_639 [Candidatus Saccharibacteria bacterium]|nr:hypothetical protein [Candidatus Saccharibacteria bacterium]
MAGAAGVVAAGVVGAGVVLVLADLVVVFLVVVPVPPAELDAAVPPPLAAAGGADKLIVPPLTLASSSLPTPSAIAEQLAVSAVEAQTGLKAILLLPAVPFDCKVTVATAPLYVEEAVE